MYICRPRLPSGSSPLTRGALERGDKITQLVGIIPAYAGSTSNTPRFLHRRRDHPRLRGEHHEVVLDHRLLEGSSPLTRGARIYDFLRNAQVGIIPAYAGSTQVI